MADAIENKRVGRENELRQKLKDTVKRFEDVFAKPLSTVVLKEFLDESEKNNRMIFLKDRMGQLSDADVNYLRNVLKENVVSTTKAAVVSSDELDDVDDVDDLG